MKILSAKQVYQADQATIKKQAISSIDLMEKAADTCFHWIKDHIPLKNREIHIFCGIGNNGGDGLVIARKLIQESYEVFTYIVNFSDRKANDFAINFDSLLNINHHPTVLNASDEFPEMKPNSLIIDAIFGIGLTRPPVGFVKEIIENINRSSGQIVSIDFPSGLFSEATVSDSKSVIRADYTLTFQNPKLAFFLPENEVYLGKWSLLDIGLDQNFINALEAKYQTVDTEQIGSIYKKRSKFSHKGTFGHSLIIGGSFGKIGAVVLASKAALKIGSGLVTSYIPKCGYTILQTSIPEVMVEVDDEKYIQYFNYKTVPNSIGIGVGLGTHLKTISGFANFLKTNQSTLVLDADALNILSRHPELLELIPENSILTPHPKEFERLVGQWQNDYEKLEKLTSFSSKYKMVVVLKGAYTAIAHNNRIYFNTSGNPALATAGSGDVLTGIITGLKAQNYTSVNAAILGVYIHGSAADIAINRDLSMETFTASDGICYLTEAYKNILEYES